MEKSSIKIGDICYQTYPCKHKVEINGVRSTMSGNKIALFLLEHGENVPDHFMEYIKCEYETLQSLGETSESKG